MRGVFSLERKSIYRMVGIGYKRGCPHLNHHVKWKRCWLPVPWISHLSSHWIKLRSPNLLFCRHAFFHLKRSLSFAKGKAQRKGIWRKVAFSEVSKFTVPLHNTETLIFLYMEVALYNVKSQGLESEDMSWNPGSLLYLELSNSYSEKQNNNPSLVVKIKWDSIY